MEKLEEIDELRLDFTKLEKVGGQVTATRASGASSCDPGVIPVAVQNADTKEVILVAYTNEFAMKESFAKRKLVLWSTSRNKLWFKGETSGETFDLLEAYVNCEQNSLLYGRFHRKRNGLIERLKKCRFSLVSCMSSK